VKVNLAQLTSHLSRDLAPAYLVAGDEPLLVSDALREIRSAAMRSGFEDREQHVVERGYNWAALEAGTENLSLFSSKRIIELRIPSPRLGVEGGKTIRKMVEHPVPDCLLLIATTKLDRTASQSAWVKCIEHGGVVLQVWPIDRQKLPNWIVQRAKSIGLDMSGAASELLAERIEGNLLAADQELQKLLMLLGKGSVSEKAVVESVASNARFDVFSLMDAMLARDDKRTMRALNVLQDEGASPSLVLWAVSRELFLLARLKAAVLVGDLEVTAMQRNKVWKNRQPLVSRALKRCHMNELIALIKRASHVDNVIKGIAKGNPWNELIGLVIEVLRPTQSQPTDKAHWQAN
tara:strand:- start:8394 stop:9440 length:1047 start_codon:yes stop_codon:yes gene_type:complete